MTAVTMPGPRRSLIGKAGAALKARAHAKGRPSRLAAAIGAARQHVVTAAALASADFGAFTTWHHGGWIALAVSLLVLDFAVTG